MGYILLLLARNLVLTVLIEGAAALIMHRRLGILYPTLLCNLATNPALNFLLILIGFLGGGALPPFVYPTALILLETAAVLVEAWILRTTAGLTRPWAFLTSLIMNALSWGTGALIWG